MGLGISNSSFSSGDLFVGLLYAVESLADSAVDLADPLVCGIDSFVGDVLNQFHRRNCRSLVGARLNDGFVELCFQVGDAQCSVSDTVFNPAYAAIGRLDRGLVVGNGFAKIVQRFVDRGDLRSGRVGG